MRAAPLVLFLLALLVVAAPARAGDPIMPLSDVHGGMHCTGLTVVRGTDISSFDVEVLDVVVGATTNDGPMILVRVSGPVVDATGVAQGFSGSPIYCPDGAGTQRNIGALSEGLGAYGDRIVLATPIESILGESPDPPSGARTAPELLRSAHPLASPLSVSGLNPGLAHIVQLAGRRVGRFVVTAPNSPALGFPVQTLRPGSSVAAGLASGNLELSAIGTVAYTDGDAVWGFGHALDGAGRRSLLLQDAYVYTVVANPLAIEALGVSSYKLASAGHDLGTLTNDAPDAIVGRVGPLPRQIPIRVVARDGDTGRVAVTTASLADETAVDLPTGTSALMSGGTLTTLDPAVSILGGSPARETGHMCVRIKLHERPKPLGFCNRYVAAQSLGDTLGAAFSIVPFVMAADFTNAASAIDNYEAGRLQVDSVEVSETLHRGASQAAIVSAHAPRVVRAGSRIPVRLGLVLRDGSRRTVRFRVRVPRNAAGRRRLDLHGTALDGEDSEALLSLLGAAFTISLGDEEPPPAPHSVGALTRQIANIHRFDGVRARFARPGADEEGALVSPGKRVYLDRADRVTGRAALKLLVLPRR